LQVFTEVFGDYLANPELDFKINMRFLEVPQFQEVWVNGMKPRFRRLWTFIQAQPVIYLY